MIIRTRANWPISMYYDRVLADGPQSFWPLDEVSGTVAHDIASAANTATFQGSVVVGNPGLFPSSYPVMHFDGSTAYLSTSIEYTNPTVFSLEVVFLTTAAQGKLIGFGASQTGSSSSYDRHLYIESTGVLSFGCYTGSTVTITTAASVTDGHWHHAVATIGSSGMALYLDGTLQSTNSNTTSQNYSGWWRIGYDNLSGWPNAPSSDYFAGLLARAAVYPVALSAAQVLAHYNAARTGPLVV